MIAFTASGALAGAWARPSLSMVAVAGGAGGATDGGGPFAASVRSTRRSAALRTPSARRPSVRSQSRSIAAVPGPKSPSIPRLRPVRASRRWKALTSAPFIPRRSGRRSPRCLGTGAVVAGGAGVLPGAGAGTEPVSEALTPGWAGAVAPPVSAWAAGAASSRMDARRAARNMSSGSAACRRRLSRLDGRGTNWGAKPHQHSARRFAASKLAERSRFRTSAPTRREHVPSPGLARRQRRSLRARGGGAHAPGAPPARRSRPHRNPRRLRHVELWCLHRAGRRREREVVHAARCAGRRRRGHHHRGTRRARQPASAAGGVLGQPRAAVRLLHAGDDHGRGRPARPQPAPDRGGGARGARRQPLPLHGLPQHRQVGPRGRRGSAGMSATEAPPQSTGGYVGQAIRRKEDPRLITGRAKYVDDLTPTRTLWCAFVRSPEAHAKITSI